MHQNSTSACGGLRSMQAQGLCVRTYLLIAAAAVAGWLCIGCMLVLLCSAGQSDSALHSQVDFDDFI
jgi:hypothetical protein